MNIAELNDRIMLAKESIKARLFHNQRTPLTEALIRHLELRNVERVILGKPNTLIVVAKDKVVKMPLDKQSEIRCRVNKVMLKRLRDASISSLTPRFFEEGSFEGRPYYCEEKMSGTAIDLPISKMNEMVIKAANLITKFHQETAKDIIMDEISFKMLFGRDFGRLLPYLNDEYKIKLLKIQEDIKKEVIGNKFKTVWFQGDYKIENVLFDTVDWQIKGIIDWDLSRQHGLPLLDIFYLLMYKDGVETKKTVARIFRDKFMSLDSVFLETEIVGKYMCLFKISKELLRALLIMFWLNHITGRYQQQLNNSSIVCDEWFVNNINDVVDRLILRGKTCRN